MNRLFLVAGLCFASACATQPKTPASLQEQLERIEHSAAVDPIDPLPLLIANALAKDKNVVRAYLAQKPSDSGRPVYVLAPIFENEYPQEAISAAYNAFYQVEPEGELDFAGSTTRLQKALCQSATDLCAPLTFGVPGGLRCSECPLLAESGHSASSAGSGP